MDEFHAIILAWAGHRIPPPGTSMPGYDQLMTFVQPLP